MRAEPEPEPRAPLPLWMALFAAALLFGLHRAHVGGDALLYIAHGRFILEHRELPGVDPFSEMSVRTPLILHMLLPMIAFAWVEARVGLPPLVLASALAGAAVLLAFLLPARRSLQATLAGVALLSLLVFVDTEFYEVRGQVWAYLLFAGWLAICRRALDGRRLPLPFVVLVPALWANVHPSFLLGIALPLLLAGALLAEPPPVRRAARPLLVLAGTAALLSLLSPYGPALLVDVTRLVFDETTQRIAHMRTPPLQAPWALFLLALVGIIAARAVRGPRRHRRLDVIVAVALVFLVLTSRRYAPIAAAWCVTLLPAALSGLSWSKTAARAATLGAGLAAVAALPLVPAPRDVYWNLPIEATYVLETADPPPRLFNEFGWGGWLMYRFGEQRPIFIDGRNNLYRNGVFEDYLQIVHAAPSMDALLDIYQVSTIFWTSGWPLDGALAARPEQWRELYRDEKAVIYVRR
jgi:hypothetical protein